VWTLYVCSQSIFKPASGGYVESVVLGSLILLTCVCLLHAKLLDFTTLAKGIFLLAVLESLVCIAQFLGIIKSGSPLFPVTGTRANPNITAMFLAASFPAALYAFKASANFRKSIFYSCIILLTAALFCLNCRTAYIGAAIPMLFLFFWKKGLFERKNRQTALVTVIAILLVAIPVSISLYRMKQASADGRTLIWRLTTEMIIDGSGFGYG
jgi:hypothetical protein